MVIFKRSSELPAAKVNIELMQFYNNTRDVDNKRYLHHSSEYCDKGQ